MNIKEQMKLQKWADDMADQKSSGLSQIQYCQMKGIPKSTFEYHCKRVRDAMQEVVDEKEANDIIPVHATPPEPVFAKVELKSAAAEPEHIRGICIKRNDIMIQIAPDSDTEHIKLVLGVLTNAG